MTTPIDAKETDVSGLVSKSKKLRIVTMAFNELGHFIPIVRLTAALEKQGHEVLAVISNGCMQEKFRGILNHHGVRAPLECPENFSRNALRRGIDREHEIVEASLEPMHDERVWKPHQELVAKLNPDMIVCDFFSQFPMMIADNLKIPVVANVALPLSINYFWFLPGLTVNQSARSCFCCLCIMPELLVDFMGLGLTCAKCCASKEKRRKQDYMMLNTLKNRVCLVNSYFGFENVCALPPNIHLTGPLVEESSNLLDNLA